MHFRVHRSDCYPGCIPADHQAAAAAAAAATAAQQATAPSAAQPAGVPPAWLPPPADTPGAQPAMAPPPPPPAAGTHRVAATAAREEARLEAVLVSAEAVTADFKTAAWARTERRAIEKFVTLNVQQISATQDQARLPMGVSDPISGQAHP